MASGAGPNGEMAVAGCGQGPGRRAGGAPSGHRRGCGRCAGARSAQCGHHVPGGGAYLVPAGHQVKAGTARLGEAGRQEPQLNHAIWVTTAHLAMRKAGRMAASGREGGLYCQPRHPKPPERSWRSPAPRPPGSWRLAAPRIRRERKLAAPAGAIVASGSLAAYRPVDVTGPQDLRALAPGRALLPRPARRSARCRRLRPGPAGRRTRSGSSG